jgi:predicted RNase H-like nuclease (RuvC/YqgF family)
VTRQSDELKKIIKEAKELDAATAARVLVVIADTLEAFEKQVEEFKQQMRETNVGVQKSFIDTGSTIQSLREELSDYRNERNQSELLEKKIAFEIANKRVVSGLTTVEKMEIGKVVDTAMKADKIDIRGIKVPSRFVPWMIVGVFLLLVLMLFVFPDVIAQILLRMAGVVGEMP